MPANNGGNQRINIQNTGEGPGFPPQTGLSGQPGFPASAPVKGATAPYWSYGSGIPTFDAPVGCLYTDISINTVAATCLWIRVPRFTGAALVLKWVALF